MLGNNYEHKDHSEIFGKNNHDCLTNTRISTYKNKPLIIFSTFLKSENNVKLKQLIWYNSKI